MGIRNDASLVIGTSIDHEKFMELATKLREKAKADNSFAEINKKRKSDYDQEDHYFEFRELADENDYDEEDFCEFVGELCLYYFPGIYLFVTSPYFDSDLIYNISLVPGSVY